MNRSTFLNWFMWGLCVIALTLVVLPTIDIIIAIVSRSLGAWNFSVFTTPTTGISGGLLNAWSGTIMLMILLLILAAPLGIAGGIYLAEFSSKHMAQILRFGADVLAGVPSIIVGYVIYLIFVVNLGWSFSALAGGIALTIIVIPYIMKSTETALRHVPVNLREAGIAMGLSPVLIIRRILLPMAVPNIMTGLVVAEALAMGETAPLIYTAGWSSNLPTLQLIHRPIGYLTYVVWTFINQPSPQAHQLAYIAAAILLIFLLLLICLGRIISTRISRFTTRYQV